MQLTNNGLIKDTPEQIKADLTAKISEKIPDFTSLPAELRTNLIDEQVEILLQIQDMFSTVFNGIAPSQANKLMLTQFGESFGIKPMLATKSSVTVIFSGEPAVIIPEGTQVSNEEGNQIFATTETAIIQKDGKTSVYCLAVNEISNPILPNTINLILNSILGVSCNNPVEGNNGLPAETLDQYRSRLQDRFQSARVGNIASGYSDIVGISGVERRLVDFRQSIKVINGIQTNALECVVGGGVDVEIAKTLFNSFLNPSLFVSEPSNNETDRSILVQVKINNSKFDVRFTRPKTYPIDINITMKTVAGSILISNSSLQRLFRPYYENYLNNLKVGTAVSYFTIQNLLYKALNENGYTEDDLNMLAIVVKVNGSEVVFDVNNKIPTFFDVAYVLNELEVEKV